MKFVKHPALFLGYNNINVSYFSFGKHGIGMMEHKKHWLSVPSLYSNKFKNNYKPESIHLVRQSAQ
jgi:hypothetical protein